MKTVHIYTLSDPRTGYVRYVGKTSDLKQRLWVHLHEARGTKKNNWIHGLKILGLAPVMEAIETIECSSDADWQDAEKFWIESLRFMGCDLLNLAEGGIGCAPTEATKAKIGAANRGRFRTLEMRARMSEAWKRSGRSRSHLSKVIDQNRGRKRTLETKRKIGLAQVGRKKTPEQCANMAASKGWR